MAKMSSTERFGFLYIILAHFALGVITCVNTIYFDVIILSLSIFLGIMIGLLDYAYLRDGLDLIFRKKEVKQ